MAGVGRVIRRPGPRRRSSSEPANAQLVGSGTPQERNAEGEPTAGHPAFEPHPIQGWTPDFIPLVLQEAIDGHYYDELIPIAGPEGMKWARELAAKEGILTGVSGGSTFGVAMKVAETAPPGSMILAMLPDTGERYLSTPLFEPFGADMNEAEMAIDALDTGLPDRLDAAMCGRYMITSSFEAMARLFEAEPRRARGGRDRRCRAPERLADRGDPGRRQRRRPAAAGGDALGPRAPVVQDPDRRPAPHQRPGGERGDQARLRKAVRERRCLIPADGFYEWRGEKGAKEPFVIRPPGGGIIAFAGLWEELARPADRGHRHLRGERAAGADPRAHAGGAGV